MALSKESPVIILDTVASLATLQSTAASSTIDTANSIQVAVEVAVTYGAGTKGVRLDCYASVDGSVWSSTPFASYDLVWQISTSSTQVFSIANAPRYIQCKVYNADSVTATNIKLRSQRQLVA